MVSWLSAPLFRWEKPLHMYSSHADSPVHTQTSLTYPPFVLTWTAKLNVIAQFLQLWHSPPGILVHPHTSACNLLKAI